MNTKNILIGFVVVALIAIGGYFYPHTKQSITAGSPTGATFGDAKVAAVVMAPATSAASSTAILNTDGSDRFITDSFGACSTVGTSLTYLTGTGLKQFSFNISTSSTSTQVGNVNYAANIVMPTSTPTTDYVASSTEGFPLYEGRRWPANTYEVFTANATNTATCTIGVHYISS